MSERLDPRLPIIVGTGQIMIRDTSTEPLEPADLMAEALRQAEADSHKLALGLREKMDRGGETAGDKDAVAVQPRAVVQHRAGDSAAALISCGRVPTTLTIRTAQG